MKRRLISLILCFGIMLSVSGTAFAADNTEVDLANGITLSNTATGITETGDNLVGPQNFMSVASMSVDDVIITAASVQNDMVNITGTANDIPFIVSGPFCSISDNGNVLVFDGVDSTDNFRVVYCAIEKELDKAALYFDTFVSNNSEYSVVTKLYLAPNSDADGEYIMVELYGNEFPFISHKAISDLPEDHQLNLFWYAREFEPINVSSQEETESMSRSGNNTYIQLESYTFNHLGMRINHYLRHMQDCNIRDISGNSVSVASAAFWISEKWVEAPLENDCSDNSSALSLQDVSIVYLTRPNTAVDSMLAQGNVTKGSSISIETFKIKIGVGIKGISFNPSLNFTWEPGNNNLNAGVYHTLHVNSPGKGYWREAEAKLETGYYLNKIGNEFTVIWNYSGYDATPSTKNASLVFKYYVYNNLNSTQGHAEIDERSFPVIVK